MTKHVVITSNVKATFDLVYPRFNVPVPCYSLQFVAEGRYPSLPTRQSFPSLVTVLTLFYSEQLFNFTLAYFVGKTQNR